MHSPQIRVLRDLTSNLLMQSGRFGGRSTAVCKLSDVQVIVRNTVGGSAATLRGTFARHGSCKCGGSPRHVVKQK